MDEKFGRVDPKTKTSKNDFCPVDNEEFESLISNLKFYDFNTLDVVDGVNLAISFRQPEIPRFCDVVEGFCPPSAYSEFENKLSSFIAYAIDLIPEEQCYIVRYGDSWVVNEAVVPDLHIALERNNVTDDYKAIVGEKCNEIVSAFIKSCLRYNSFIQIVFPCSQVVISPSDHLDVFIAYHSDAIGTSLRQLLQQDRYGSTFQASQT